MQKSIMNRKRTIAVMVLASLMNITLLRIAYRIVDEYPVLVYVMGVFSWIVGAAVMVSMYWKNRRRKY